MQLPSDLFSFFSDLKLNNNRDWFNTNKLRFKSLETQVKIIGEGLKDKLNQHDYIDRFKLFRIYRDVRFSNDKTPYKTHFGLSWQRLKPLYRGGYYLHLSPGNNFLACGFWNPNPSDLRRIRQEIDVDGREYRSILNNNTFKSVWGELQGETVKTAPNGYSKDHPHIDLLRFKQHIFTIKYNDDIVCETNFIDSLNRSLQTVRPFVDYMSEVLTTNADGESLVKETSLLI